MEITNYKKISKKFITRSLIVLTVTFILGMMFLFSLGDEFYITGGDKSSFIDPDNNTSNMVWIFPAGFLLEAASYIYIGVICVTTPIIANMIMCMLSIVARIFQIGTEKRWKNITTKVLLIISIVLQGLLSVYVLFLGIAFSKYDSLAFDLYAISFVNIVAVVKSILNFRNKKNKALENENLDSQIM